MGKKSESPSLPPTTSSPTTSDPTSSPTISPSKAKGAKSGGKISAAQYGAAAHESAQALTHGKLVNLGFIVAGLVATAIGAVVRRRRLAQYERMEYGDPDIEFHEFGEEETRTIVPQIHTLDAWHRNSKKGDAGATQYGTQTHTA